MEATMTNSISVIVPAHNEQLYIGRCLESIRTAERQVSARVEVVVVQNRCTDYTGSIAKRYGASLISEDARSLARIRNAGVQASRGRIVVTIDADSWMSSNMLCEVSRRIASGKYVGGGVRIMPERLSVGILFSAMTFAPKLILEQSWAGNVLDAATGFRCYRRLQRRAGERGGRRLRETSESIRRT